MDHGKGRNEGHRNDTKVNYSIRVRKCLVRRLEIEVARLLSKDSSGVGNPADETAQQETYRNGNQANNEKFHDRRDINR